MSKKTSYPQNINRQVHWIYFLGPILITIGFYILQYIIKDDFKNEEFKDFYGILILACTSTISAIIALYKKQNTFQSTFNDLHFISNEHFETTKINQKNIKESIGNARNLISVLAKEVQNGSKKTLLRLEDFNHTKIIGQTYYNKFLKKFQVDKENKGFEVFGHSLSIEAYLYLWDHLIKLQRKIRQNCMDENGNIDQKKLESNSLIFRSTHSNDLRIFDHKRGGSAGSIRSKQLKFKSLGGYIVRIILGLEEIKDNKDQEIFDQMIIDEIDARFLKVNKEDLNTHDGLQYDFAWITNNEFEYDSPDTIDLIAIWETDNNNYGIKSCSIFEKRIPDYLNDWEDVGIQVETKENPFKIPPERNIISGTPIYNRDH